MDRPATAPGARLVVLGSAAIAEGFSLIGAEVYPDATPEVVEQVLGRLSAAGDPALVLIEGALAHAGGEHLGRLRNEGGHIVVTELPPLTAPQDYAPAVDAVVRQVLGGESLRSEP